MTSAIVEIDDDAVHLTVRRDGDRHPNRPLVDERRVLHLGVTARRDGRVGEGPAELLVETVRRMREAAARAGAGQVSVLVTGRHVRGGLSKGLQRRLGVAAGGTVRVVDEDEHPVLALAAGAPEGTAVLAQVETDRLRLVLGRDGRAVWIGEFDVGVGSLMREAASHPGHSDAIWAAMTDAAHERLTLAAAPLRRRALQTVAVTGRLTSDLAGAVGTAATRTDSGWRLDVDALREVARRLLRDGGSASLPGGSTLHPPQGVGPTAALSLAATAVLVSEIADLAGAGRVHVRERGVADVLLLPRRAMHRRDVAEQAAGLLAAEPAHAAQVARLAAALFDATGDLHRLGPAARRVLMAGAWLHDAGTGLGAGTAHRVGARIAEQVAVPGFARHERAAIASLVRFHKGAGPSLGYDPYAGLHPSWRHKVVVLTALLQVADGLDRGHDGAVDQIEVAADDELVTLDLHGSGELEYARWGATAKAPLFERCFDRRLDVVVADHAVISLPGLARLRDRCPSEIP